MERVQSALHYLIVLSAASHVFCCVLPTMISLASLLTGLGIFYSAFPVVEAFHESMHAYEAPLLIFSVLVVSFGWLVHGLSRRMDCHDTGCCHGPCNPQKQRARFILYGGTALTVFNLTVFAFAG